MRGRYKWVLLYFLTSDLDSIAFPTDTSGVGIALLRYAYLVPSLASMSVGAADAPNI